MLSQRRSMSQNHGNKSHAQAWSTLFVSPGNFVFIIITNKLFCLYLQCILLYYIQHMLSNWWHCFLHFAVLYKWVFFSCSALSSQGHHSSFTPLFIHWVHCLICIVLVCVRTARGFYCSHLYNSLCLHTYVRSHWMPRLFLSAWHSHTQTHFKWGQMWRSLMMAQSAELSESMVVGALTRDELKS